MDFQTDLNIGAINNDWGLAVTNGSLGIFVWESTDLVNWSSDRLVTVMTPDAGMVWAPSAVANPDKPGSYVVFWASRVFAEDDTAHAGPASQDRIYYAETSDFYTFTAPQIWVEAAWPVIDQELLHLGGSSWLRFIKNEQDLKVYTERSDAGLFGTWSRITNPSTGAEYVTNDVREGPAVFPDIRDADKTWLWLDDYSGNGSYKCYYAPDRSALENNAWSECNPQLSPAGMRHGGVLQVNQSQLDALRARYPA